MGRVGHLELDARRLDATWAKVCVGLDQLQRGAASELLLADSPAGEVMFLAFAVRPRGFLVTARGSGEGVSLDLIDPSVPGELVEVRLPNGEPAVATLNALVTLEQVRRAAEHFFTAAKRWPGGAWRDPLAIDARLAAGEVPRRL